ncbi:hypothetical protein F511_17001 [Dorcoceras hygrometricum]|uniref:CCHC-type domain-containing protein n=1 Tax=Dorcoceras hygrometricum TaxID=472368 RepID=A0A2Z7BXW2_9LAMI|nr:hypothetical protein F511_17001 [Dorcoceras hygrometricum]
MIKHDVRLAEPVDYKAAVNKALRAEQDWKAIDEERQLKRQAFQQNDKRKFKKQNNNNHQGPKEKGPIAAQPISSVPYTENRPPCPNCKKKHKGQCLQEQNVCYTCGKPGHMSRNYMSGRGRDRRSFVEGDSESEGITPVLANMAQLLERLVDQTSNGNGHFNSKRKRRRFVVATGSPAARNPGSTAGRGFNPAGGAPGSG